MVLKNKNLAITGGDKTINLEKPHYIWPPITEKTRNAVLRQLDDKISLYDRSNVVERLELKLQDYHAKKHALLTNSGTTSLYSMYVGAGIKEGDEVICPAYTFFATVTPLFHTGAVPILVDCQRDGNISPVEIEKKINKKTKGITITHMWGIPCDMDPIIDLSRKYSIPIFEDASHAHGAEYKGKKVGTFGEAAAFSMQGKKTVSAGEGGFLLTDNDDIYYKALLLGHFNKRCLQEIPKGHALSRFSISGIGLHLRIHPLAAALAEEQFDNLDTVLHNRRKAAERMTKELENLPGLEMPQVPDHVKPTWYAFVMQYKAEELEGLSIERFYDALMAEGCTELDRPGSTGPLNHLSLFHDPEPFFSSRRGYVDYSNASFPNAEKFYNNALKLPVWQAGEEDKIIDLYIAAFRRVIANYKELL